MRKKIYISGQITGLPIEKARYLFEQAESFLYNSIKADPYNPMKFSNCAWSKWEDVMKFDIKYLMACEGIYMLRNWKESKGAILEHHIAKELGYLIIYQQ
ncbi:MAG: hypothetical protein A2W17_04500 [Planctomycetes bacterium RBG_16_41_13]|nr:MAG: hypothetical protein A2W17_04500 [Planctomycetes bacterium RBG_16_41_13]